MNTPRHVPRSSGSANWRARAPAVAASKTTSPEQCLVLAYKSSVDLNAAAPAFAPPLVPARAPEALLATGKLNAP